MIGKKTKRLLWITAIGTALGMLIYEIFTAEIEPILNFLKRVLVGIWKALGEGITLPLWTILIVGAWILLTLLVGAYAILIRLSSNQPHRSYFECEFLGMIWEWNYLGQEPQSPICRCKRCKMVLLWNIYESYVNPGSIKIQCEHCNQVQYQTSGTRTELQNRVLREIDRRMRSGEWKADVAQVEKLRTQVAISN